MNPADLDLNIHMNNGRYLSIMDLGRFDLMLQSGTFLPLLKQGFYPVVASQVIQFHKSLEPFETFDLVTRIDSFDGKDFFMAQDFMRGDEIVAQGFIRSRFKKRGQRGSVDAAVLFAALHRDVPTAPAASSLAAQHVAVEGELKATRP